jgi:hypothetical protein
MVATEATEKPSGSQEQQPSTFTIQKGDPSLPKEMEQWQTGDKVTIQATVQAIDDAGVTFAPDGEITKQEAAPEPDADDAGDGSNPQADFVAKKRRENMMGEGSEE